MNQKLTMTELVYPEEIEHFWTEYCAYLKNDIYPKVSIGTPLSEEQREKLTANEHKEQMVQHIKRECDPSKIVYFMLEGQRIGFCWYCIYRSEDAKCFIIDFCIFEPFRSCGNGSAAFELLKQRTKEEGAQFYELSVSNELNRHFWEKQGFQYNGYDSYGTMLLMIPPTAMYEFSYEKVKEEDVWQIVDLMNGYKAEIGEEFLSESQQERVIEAISNTDILFFVAKYRTRVVGMCSISLTFSTFQCMKSGVFEDFYIEPLFRKKGAACGLAAYVFSWCGNNKVSGLTVGCADCDVQMYQKIGFQLKIGTLLAWNKEE